MRPNSRIPPIGLTVTFTNRFDAYYLLGKVFWCGCEFIAFTTHNIFTNFDCVFPTRDGMHTLPYYIGEDGMERRRSEDGGEGPVSSACLALACQGKFFIF